MKQQKNSSAQCSIRETITILTTSKYLLRVAARGNKSRKAKKGSEEENRNQNRDFQSNMKNENEMGTGGSKLLTIENKRSVINTFAPRMVGKGRRGNRDDINTVFDYLKYPIPIPLVKREKGHETYLGFTC